MDLGLRGRTALVTGGSAGIGVGIAEMLAAEGVRVAIAGRSEPALAKVADAIAAAGHARPALVTGDLAAADGPGTIAQSALAALGGRVDILVNNAGGSRPYTGVQPDAFWDEAYALNFTAARQLTEQLTPAMRAAKWGRVVNITGALYGKATNAAGAAKAALLAWSRAQAFELAPHGITVNCVAPGRIHSVQIDQRLHPTEESRAAYIRDNIPMGRFGEPKELAALVVFLASPLAGYISGAQVPVDGGAVRIAV